MKFVNMYAKIEVRINGTEQWIEARVPSGDNSSRWVKHQVGLRYGMSAEWRYPIADRPEEQQSEYKKHMLEEARRRSFCVTSFLSLALSISTLIIIGTLIDIPTDSGFGVLIFGICLVGGYMWILSWMVTLWGWLLFLIRDFFYKRNACKSKINI